MLAEMKALFLDHTALHVGHMELTHQLVLQG